MQYPKALENTRKHKDIKLLMKDERKVLHK